MKLLNLTVLYIESTPSRLYLSLLEKNGYLPIKIIHIDIEPKSRLYLILRIIVGAKLANYFLERYRGFKSSLKSANTRLANKMLKNFSLSIKDLRFNIDQYPSSQCERISVLGLDDEKLIEKLESEDIKTFLFTGGGILKSNLLSIEGSKFFHIHPGIVPHVKGADGFFWSLLLRKRPGYSVFYMNPGIDTGDIVHQKEFEFPCSEWSSYEGSNSNLYHSILQFYDPALRILTFIDMLDIYFKDEEEPELNNLNCISQAPDEGRTYFFMHKEIRRFVIDNIIRRKSLSKL